MNVAAPEALNKMIFAILRDIMSEVTNQLFDHFCSANTFQSILEAFRQLSDVVGLDRRSTSCSVLLQLKSKLSASWKAQLLWSKLEKRASHYEYRKGTACTGTRVFVIGAGPCGLRVAIELALLGAHVVVVEKRDSFSRNNVLHLWPHLIHDLKVLGAKKFFGKFCAGSIDHISIRTLQCILLKVALVVGVEVHCGVTFESLTEPPVDQTVDSFKKKEFRGKLAIAITANFINHNTQAEASVEEISGVSYIFNQRFFKDLNQLANIDLENIVYYKDETHYFVMTAKKHSLLYKGVVLQDDEDPQRLLAKDNVNQAALLEYAIQAANIATQNRLPNLEFAHNHYGQPDVAMFDFTSMYAAEHACRVIERRGHRLLVGLVGDTLLEPFWPIGSGCARGFLGALDTAWMVRSWSSGKMTPLEVIAERESIYQLLSQTTPENLNKSFAQHTIDPNTRYRNVNLTFFKAHQVKDQYDGTDMEYINKIVELSQQKAKSYDYVRDSHNLLRWFQRQLEPYRNLVKVVDLTTSWRNGLALCALIHLYRPHLLDVYALDSSQSSANNQLAFDIAEREFGLSPVITGCELVNCDVLDKSILVSYLSQFYELFRKESVEREAASKENVTTNNELQVKSRRLKQEIDTENSSLKRVQTQDDSIPLKRLRDILSCESFELPQYTAQSTADVLKDLDSGVRGQNKVSVLAKDLATKIEAERHVAPPSDEPRKRPSVVVKPMLRTQVGDVCYFCNMRVYIVERYTLRGIIFHRNCLRCDYCNSVLRVSNYACLTTPDLQLKFYCVQHSGLQKLSRPAATNSIGGRASRGGAKELYKYCLSPPRSTATNKGRVKKPAERAEYTTESEIEETELEQTRHNNIHLLRTTAYSDSSSSEEELQFSDDADDSEELPDINWQEMIRRKQAPPVAPPTIVAAANQQLSSGTDTDTVGGASDADWETDSDTECDDVTRDRERPKVVGAVADSRPTVTLSPQQITATREMPKSSPTSTAIMRNRMAFFSAPTQPVRINARSFLGLDPQPATETRNLEKPECEQQQQEEEDVVDVVSKVGEVELKVKTKLRREPVERVKKRHKRRKKRPTGLVAMETDRLMGQVAMDNIEKHAALPIVALETVSSPDDEQQPVVRQVIPLQALSSTRSGQVKEQVDRVQTNDEHGPSVNDDLVPATRDDDLVPAASDDDLVPAASDDDADEFITELGVNNQESVSGENSEEDISVDGRTVHSEKLFAQEMQENREFDECQLERPGKVLENGAESPATESLQLLNNEELEQVETATQLTLTTNFTGNFHSQESLLDNCCMEALHSLTQQQLAEESSRQGQGRGGERLRDEDEEKSRQEQGNGGERLRDEDEEKSRQEQGNGGERLRDEDEEKSRQEQGNGGERLRDEDEESSRLEQGRGRERLRDEDEESSRLEQGSGKERLRDEDEESSRLEQGRGRERLGGDDEESSRQEQGSGKERSRDEDEESSRLEQGRGGERLGDDDEESSRQEQGSGKERSRDEDEESSRQEQGLGKERSRDEDEESSRQEQGLGKERSRDEDEESSRQEQGLGKERSRDEDEESSRQGQEHGEERLRDVEAPTTDTRLDSSQAPVTDTKHEFSQAPVTDTSQESSQAPVTDTRLDSSQAPVTDTRQESSQAPVTDTSQESSQAPVTDTKHEFSQVPVTNTRQESSHAPVTDTSQMPVIDTKQESCQAPMIDTKQESSRAQITDTKHVSSQINVGVSGLVSELFAPVKLAPRAAVDSFSDDDLELYVEVPSTETSVFHAESHQLLTQSETTVAIPQTSPVVHITDRLEHSCMDRDSTVIGQDSMENAGKQSESVNAFESEIETLQNVHVVSETNFDELTLTENISNINCSVSVKPLQTIVKPLDVRSLDPLSRIDLLLESLSHNRLADLESVINLTHHARQLKTQQERLSPPSQKLLDNVRQARSHDSTESMNKVTVASHTVVVAECDIDRLLSVENKDDVEHCEKVSSLEDMSLSGLDVSCQDASVTCRDVMSCPADIAPTDDNVSTDCLATTSFDDDLSVDNIVGDEEMFEIETSCVTEPATQQLALKCSVDLCKPTTLLSPNRIIDAKRRFFCEPPQPVRIDHQQIFNEIPSTNFHSAKSLNNTMEHVVNGQSSLVQNSSQKVCDTINSALKRRQLPSIPVTVGQQTASVGQQQQPQQQQQQQPMQSISENMVTQQKQATKTSSGKKRPSSALILTTAEQEALLASTVSIRTTSPIHKVASASQSDGATVEGSPSGGRREGLISWSAFHRPKSKTKPVGVSSETTDQTDRKDKKKSLLSLLIPSKNVDKRDKTCKESPPVLVTQPTGFYSETGKLETAREKTKSLPMEKKRSSSSPMSERFSAEKRKSKGSKSSRSGKKNEVESGSGATPGDGAGKTVYEEMAPIIEGIKRVERRNKEKANIHERIQAVAPPPAKAPNTVLLPPKADIEDFETESEFGDDRLSLRSFHSHTTEDSSKIVRRQQKAARRKQREKELCRFHLAQEIQSQLEQLENRRSEVEQRGVVIEKALRGDTSALSSVVDENKLMQDWFNVVHEKNVLAGYESELVVHSRELELEDRQSRLEIQLRERIAPMESESKPSLADDEQRILQELMEVVQQRDALVALLEEDRLKQQQYDHNLERIMLEAGFIMSPVECVQQLRQTLSALSGGTDR